MHASVPFRFHVLAAAALWGVTGTALCAPPKEIYVTRELQDFYRVASGPLYIKTMNCNEFVYADRANLRFDIAGKGGAITFRSGRACKIERLFREVDPHAPDTFPAATFSPGAPPGAPSIPR